MNENNPLIVNPAASPVPGAAIETPFTGNTPTDPANAAQSPIDALLARLKAMEKSKKAAKGAFGKPTLYDSMMKKRMADPVRVARREARKQELAAKAEAKKLAIKIAMEG